MYTAMGLNLTQVIFIDEIDSVCRQRSSKEEEHTRRIKTELLRQVISSLSLTLLLPHSPSPPFSLPLPLPHSPSPSLSLSLTPSLFSLPQMEGADNSLECGDSEMFLLCATNCPWELDTAFLRRFQKRVFIPLPCRKARRKLLELHLGSTGVLMSESDWELLVTRTDGYSGSDIATCVADALLEPVRELGRATHWRPVNGGQAYMPCGAMEPGAVGQSLADLLPHQVK